MSSGTLEALDKAPLQEILQLLLAQLDAALTQRGHHLSDSESRDLISALAAGERPQCVKDLSAALIALVEDSLKTLRLRFALDFAGSLAADVTQMADWESTADLLTIANEKAQAEQTVVIASALLVACGRIEYVTHLIEVIEDDAGAQDIDAVIARRILRQFGGIEGLETEGLDRARAWHLDQSRG